MAPEAVTPKKGEQHIIGREETVEYRDQEGNILNDAAVQALMKDGKATFQTKYETRTRVVDEFGNEVQNPYAPEHPDVEGQNPDTKGIPEEKGKSMPAQAQAEVGSSANKEGQQPAQPASDANEATK